MITLDEIRAGLANGEFFLEYLPTISLVDGRCTGAEALIRWRRPSGNVQPDEFIPVSDGTPLSGRITYWVFDTVGIELSTWLRANPEAHISINIPPEILGRGGIAYAAEKSGMVEFVSQIILEVTERAVPDLLGIAAINEASANGIRIALDDFVFASGANLAILARANLSIVKLDRTLIAGINAQQPKPEWLDGITTLLAVTRLAVIAEGIETALQLQTLREAGIQEAQGFYFSRPLAAAAFIAFHRQNNEMAEKKV